MKALYLYLTAEYSTANNVLNEMVLWDKIVMNGEKMELDMKSAKVESQIINRNSNNHHVDITTQFLPSFSLLFDFNIPRLNITSEMTGKA